jgi:hypothetical protein
MLFRPRTGLHQSPAGVLFRADLKPLREWLTGLWTASGTTGLDGAA